MTVDTSSEASSFPVSLLQDEDEAAQRRGVFFFINPDSGSNDGLRLIQAGVNHLVLSAPELCEVFIFDIREGESGNKKGFLRLAAAINNPRRKCDTDAFIEAAYPDRSRFQFSVICVGGDGTVIWCITEMMKHNIDLNKVAIGVIPYGTGNDFAIAFGWKNFTLSDPFGRSLKVLRNLITVIFAAKVVAHDLWNINIEINSSGEISKIDPKSRQDNVVFVEDQKVKELSFLMGNYFSLGVESRIGRGFDRKRAHNRVVNKLMYVLEGIKKTFKTTVRTDHIIESLVETNGSDIVIFSTQRGTHTPLFKKAVSLVALNIPSFSAGNDAWKSSRSVGLKFPDKSNVKKTTLLSLFQRTGDGQLEFLSFSRVADLGLEFVFKGHGKRIHQGGGPYILRFRDIAAAQRVYFQVDGEFYRMRQPKCVSIKHSTKVYVLAPSGN